MHRILKETDVYDEGMLRKGQIGIGLSILAALFTSCGLCLQKIVHRKIARRHSLEPAYKHTMYVAGVSYVGVGLCLKAGIYLTLPLSAMSVLSAQSLVYTTLLEYYFLDGPLSKHSLLCLVTIAMGVIIASWGAQIVDQDYSINYLESVFLSPKIVILNCALLGKLVGLQVVTNGSDIGHSVLGGFAMVFTCGLLAAWFATILKCCFGLLEFQILYGTLSDPPYDSQIQVGLGLAVLVMLFGLVLFGKLKAVNLALTSSESSQFLPHYQASTIALTVLCGSCYFDDLRAIPYLPTTSPVTFGIGLGFVMAGLVWFGFAPTTPFSEDKNHSPGNPFLEDSETSNDNNFDETTSLLFQQKTLSSVSSRADTQEFGSSSSSTPTRTKLSRIPVPVIPTSALAASQLLKMRNGNSNTTSSGNPFDEESSIDSGHSHATFVKRYKLPPAVSRNQSARVLVDRSELYPNSRQSGVNGSSNNGQLSGLDLYDAN